MRKLSETGFYVPFNPGELISFRTLPSSEYVALYDRPFSHMDKKPRKMVGELKAGKVAMILTREGDNQVMILAGLQMGWCYDTAFWPCE